MNKKKVISLALIVGALSGCNTVNQSLANRQEVVEIYHIFDFKTQADVATVSRAAANGLAQNTNSVQSSTPLHIGNVVPAEPGKFVLIDMASAMGGGMGAMMQLAAAQNGSAGIKVAKCDGAVWTSKAVRNISGSSNLTLYSCLYRYRSGYNLDMYAVFSKTSGGLNGLLQSGADAVVGTPEAWVNKTILDTVRAIEGAAGTSGVHVEGQPELGPLPAVDKLGRG
ncbi:hypothetical protein CSQ93_24895 [Janthinobacterium sp. BJB426]|uniref:hypothetical protein n=1 Tax=Janthinobacterium sp. BJB426 TaxID=2048010 RepID=UPI000C0CB4FF|nr:hypothetical protein [Janthinobacterium sp. BJB426]PHV25354.1 hypothetical protein CSQ93_24895 [Janthinobacterium sp. BJB426]